MTYIKGILISIDKLGNAIAGGNNECTISGRTGYYQYNSVKAMRWYWKSLAFIIDLTFYPLDSHHHCREACLKEDDEFSKNASPLALFVLSLITIASCSILIVIFYSVWGLYKFFKLVTNKSK